MGPPSHGLCARTPPPLRKHLMASLNLPVRNDQVLNLPVLETARMRVQESTALERVSPRNNRECMLCEYLTSRHRVQWYHLPSGRYLLMMKGIFFSRNSFIAICTTNESWRSPSNTRLSSTRPCSAQADRHVAISGLASAGQLVSPPTDRWLHLLQP